MFWFGIKCILPLYVKKYNTVALLEEFGEYSRGQCISIIYSKSENPVCHQLRAFVSYQEKSLCSTYYKYNKDLLPRLVSCYWESLSVKLEEVNFILLLKNACSKYHLQNHMTLYASFLDDIHLMNWSFPVSKECWVPAVGSRISYMSLPFFWLSLSVWWM